MSLVTPSEMLTKARAGKYAVGAFEVWDLASIQAVIESAEELNQPVIMQIGPSQIDYAGLETLSRIALDHAERAKVPVVVHLDHGSSYEQVIRCIHNGFTSVMFDVSHLPFEGNVAATCEVVKVAHAGGISVEGELGRIGGLEAGSEPCEGEEGLTDPAEAVEYVTQTGIDFLAVAIGTVHGFYKGEPNVRLDLLEQIAEKVSIPLVLHGGSDTPDSIVRKAIALGIAKVNICTEFIAAFADVFATERSEPDFRYDVQGVFERPREAAKELVRKKIRLFAGL